MQKTSIDWCDLSWNPVTGCSGPNGSPCPWCYAARIAKRFNRPFEPTFHNDRLTQPVKRGRPARIFVCSMGDLFDPLIPADQIEAIWCVMQTQQRHTFQVLTKRPDRMEEWVRARVQTNSAMIQPNIWLGTSVTNQVDFDNRIHDLISTPAAIRWISYEPMLGPLDVSDGLKRWEVYDKTMGGLDWLVLGAMTGPEAIPPKRKWVENVIDQCLAANVPVFEKRSLAGVVNRALIQEFPIDREPGIC